MDARVGDFLPDSYSDVPLYNIQAAAAATGVPTITLRSWERRYGVPWPKRDPKGYRLYSERDIAITRWLRERVRQGVGISRAVNLLRVLERGDQRQEPLRTLDFGSLSQRLLDAIEHLDENGVASVLAEALMVAPVENVAMGLIQPTLHEVGVRWAHGQLSVTSEHFGSFLIRSHIAQLIRLSPPPLRQDRVLIGAAPGELHDIGALILALFLRRRGFDVVFTGASVEPQSFREDVARLQPSAVCLSATTVGAAEGLARLFDSMNADFAGVLAFGGRIYNENPGLIDRTRGVYLGSDARIAVDALEAALTS